MAASMTLYCCDPMKAAVCLSVTSEATGHPIEYALDNNPDTYWEPTDGSVNQDIVIDLGSAQTIEAYMIWIRNYTTLTNARSVEVSWSDDNVTYTFVSGTASIISAGGPVRIRLFSSLSHRYWKLRVQSDAGGQEPQISMIWLCSKWVVSQGPQYPINDEPDFHGRTVPGPGGRSYTINVNSRVTRRLTRTWLFADATYWTELYGAWNASNGKERPLVINEGTTDAEARLVKFDSLLSDNQQGYLQYNPTVVFQEIPFIPSGSTY